MTWKPLPGQMKSSCLCLPAFLILALSLQNVASIRWLALSQAQDAWNETRHCPQNKIQRKKFGLVGSQTKLCKRLTELMPPIMRATARANGVCGMLFSDRRWNCSSVNLAPRLSPDLVRGTREQAYVYALSSAAVMHSIAKACVTGEIPYCPCGALPNETPPEFKWKGCSDNVNYGKLVSIQWSDSPMRRKKRKRDKARKKQRGFQLQSRGRLLQDRSFVSMEDFMEGDDTMKPRPKMNLHNNNVGRKATEQSLQTKCKCHGVSSSCTVKTCWKTLPTLIEVGNILKEKYGRATEVRPRAKTPPRLRFEPVALVGRVTEDDLVYIRKSPDYCTKDRRVGSLGTRGRVCNATSTRHFSCNTMCCGRGHMSLEEHVEQKCHCKYVHCCYVKCKTCQFTIKKEFCK